jgi:hypothetical protein
MNKRKREDELCEKKMDYSRGHAEDTEDLGAIH